MNREFKRRHDEVLRVLAILTPEAGRLGGDLIFLGGSAVQTILKNPRRVSIDLDVYYSGDGEKLVQALAANGYRITNRRSSEPELFEFYTAQRGDIIVKIDFLKIGVPAEYASEGGFEDAARKKKSRVKIAKPEYLMAAKLSALAVGATGREAESELNLVKDVFDFNCMADEFPGLNNEIHGAIVEITRQQNKLHKTSHSVADVYGAVRKTLRGMAHIKGESSLITQGALKSFSQYLVGVPGSRWGHMKWGEFVWGEGGKAGELTRTALAVLAMRALYYSIEIEKKKKLGDVEKIIMEKVADRVFVSECERKLAEGGEDQLWLHELKILAPAALIYLYYSRFPES